MTIECKDLEWRKSDTSIGIGGWYCIVGAPKAFDILYTCNDGEVVYLDEGFDTMREAQAAANEHNKQQFQSIIEEWRKG